MWVSAFSLCFLPWNLTSPLSKPLRSSVSTPKSYQFQLCHLYYHHFPKFSSYPSLENSTIEAAVKTTPACGWTRGPGWCLPRACRWWPGETNKAMRNIGCLSGSTDGHLAMGYRICSYHDRDQINWQSFKILSGTCFFSMCNGFCLLTLNIIYPNWWQNWEL